MQNIKASQMIYVNSSTIVKRLQSIEQAKSNTIDNFKYGFEDIFMDVLISRMDQNQDIFTKMMDDENFGGLVKDYLLKKVYNQLNNK